MPTPSDGPIATGDRCRDTPHRRFLLYTTFASQPTDYSIKDGSEEHPEECHPNHAEEHHCAQGLAHFGARTSRGDERNHTENERKAGHQDWPQSQTGSLDGGGG